MWCWFFGTCGVVGGNDGDSSSAVPEIDASNGMLAVAVVVAALFLARELKRRRG